MGNDADMGTDRRIIKLYKVKVPRGKTGFWALLFLVFVTMMGAETAQKKGLFLSRERTAVSVI